MSLNDEQVRQVAHLARLDMGPEKVAALTRQLGDILAMVDQLSAADTYAVTPMAHPLEMHQRLRADTVTEIDQRERFQGIAPSVQDGLYVVPKVID